jgi:hypothetical protein
MLQGRLADRQLSNTTSRGYAKKEFVWILFRFIN